MNKTLLVNFNDKFKMAFAIFCKSSQISIFRLNKSGLLLDGTMLGLSQCRYPKKVDVQSSFSTAKNVFFPEDCILKTLADHF